MPGLVAYDRARAVRYAEAWALKRNPRYMNFDGMGGDCTNFASQCLFAGCGVMNYARDVGWYYIGPNRRAAAWSGVEYLHRFLVANRGAGPFAVEADPADLRPGDLVQLGTAGGRFYHTPVVVAVAGGQILVAAHTFDALYRPLSSYSFSALRCLHIAGARRP
ncbi:MAG TPA: amidase [Ruminococcaceae bacterium]|mgnify:CR=1 FL=1|jgi:hypothetical protein|nr:amidase [Oscillospiraceae bacterium]HBQ46384.1 amidase [Oscillospiraceae bacterium]HBT91460.1 amidase [Oscillospiraceae bacterium]HCB90483.1 amidase [Oscillospiraceae bacterium]